MPTEVWRWQGGTRYKDTLTGVSLGPNGSCTLAGYTYGNWSGTNAGYRDWTAVKLGVDGTVQWKWQGGTVGYEQFHAVTGGSDGSVVMVGNAGGRPYNFAVIKLDERGGLLWEWQGGLSSGGTAYAVTMTVDGSVVWAGSTFGLWGDSHAGSCDFTASKLDSEGIRVWSWQNGTSEKEEILAAVVKDDDSVVFAGYTYGNWTDAHGGDGDADFAAVKLDADGNELWRWQDGTTATDMVYGAANGQDGSTVLAGLTEGSWNGTHAGGTNDFAAVKLDVDGAEVWRWQDGTTKDDVVRGVAPGDDGSVVLAGYTNGIWSGQTDGTYDFAAVKLDANGVEIWRWQGGSASSKPDEVEAVAAGPNGLVVLAGWTRGSWAEEDAREYDFAAVMLDTVAPVTPPPAPEPRSSKTAASPAPNPMGLFILSAPTDGPSSLDPSPAAPTSPAPTPRPQLPSLPSPPAATPTDVDTLNTPTPGLASLAPSLVTLASGSSFSPASIGMLFTTATVVVMFAAWCLRRKHKAKQNIDENQGTEGSARVARPDEAASPTPSEDDPRSPSVGCDVARAVLEMAHNLARQSQFPGVCEAATLVSTLVNLISNDRGSIADSESRLKRCRLLVMMLQRAATVLGKIDIIEDDDSSRDTKRMLVKNVQDAIEDMVGLIKTYRSKRRITQVVVSTLFKRRMEETEAVINQTFSDLMRWLHVDAALYQGEDHRTLLKDRRKPNQARISLKSSKDGVTARPNLPRHAAAELKAEEIASDRRLRRQRNLEQVEIPEDHVLISEDVLGKGGFGTVYIADYNGRNAAAKVIEIDRDHEGRDGQAHGDFRRETKRGETDANRQRASPLLELQAMIRLRSPYTVNVYGAITFRKDRIVLVMELLTGGDLLSLLDHSGERLPEEQTRSIIGDVCAGVAFLHSKNTIHGDLKSANVLLDGDGRAKIGDFGTSRWAQHRDSTGLATFKPTQGNTMHMMSFGWAAPEVLNVKGSSYASDVYSFGIVAWEVLSMQVPWADEAAPLDIYKRVVFKGERPTIPADAPADIAAVVRASWAGLPEERPTASEIMGRLKSREV